MPEPDDFNAKIAANSLDKFIELTKKEREGTEYRSEPFFEGDLAISQELIDRYYGGRSNSEQAQVSLSVCKSVLCLCILLQEIWSQPH